MGVCLYGCNQMCVTNVDKCYRDSAAVSEIGCLLSLTASAIHRITYLKKVALTVRLRINPFMLIVNELSNTARSTGLKLFDECKCLTRYLLYSSLLK